MLAVQQGGRVLEMNAPVTQPGLLYLLTMHTEEGRRIYERSVRFLLLAATNRILPGQRVRIEYSVSKGAAANARSRHHGGGDARYRPADARSRGAESAI